MYKFRMYCVSGTFPSQLLDAWDEFDSNRTSENDRPHIFGPDQLYMIFAFADGGVDVEHYQFSHAGQVYCIHALLSIQF